jgi:hypothetical protein
MSSNEPWKAVKPSAPASTGQDPPAEAFKSAVNAFGWPHKMANYADSPLSSATVTKHLPSAYLPSDSGKRDHPVTPEQNRTAAVPTTNQSSSSNLTGAADQRLPSSRRINTQDSEPQDVSLHAQVSGSIL